MPNRRKRHRCPDRGCSWQHLACWSCSLDLINLLEKAESKVRCVTKINFLSCKLCTFIQWHELHKSFKVSLATVDLVHPEKAQSLQQSSAMFHNLLFNNFSKSLITNSLITFLFILSMTM